MKRKNILALTVVFALAVGAFLLTAVGPRAQAQPGCLAFRGIVQGELPSPYDLHPPPAKENWGGLVYASLGGEMLIGGMSGNDGERSQHGGTGGLYKVCLATPGGPWETCVDSFTYEVPNSVFGFVPGKVGLGNYQGNTAKIMEGTGRFVSASGNLNIAGPYILWPEVNPPPKTRGRWNGEFSGAVCGVAP